ncbi:MAG: conjugal transfer protein TrbF, partial [Bradyrhizobium sp.]
MVSHPFHRPSVRYGETPEPVTPYQKAAQVWDERLGSARVQAANWRIAALSATSLSAMLGLTVLLIVGRSSVVPYVVEVDRLGEVRAVGPAIEAYQPSDAQIAHFLARFIENVRSLSVDPVIVRTNWLHAYDFATDRGAQALNEYAREADPFAKIGARTATAEVTSVVRASNDSFEIRWKESTYENGAVAKTERFTG